MTSDLRSYSLQMCIRDRNTNIRFISKSSLTWSPTWIFYSNVLFSFGFYSPKILITKTEIFIKCNLKNKGVLYIKGICMTCFGQKSVDAFKSYCDTNSIPNR